MYFLFSIKFSFTKRKAYNQRSFKSLWASIKRNKEKGWRIRIKKVIHQRINVLSDGLDAKTKSKCKWDRKQIILAIIKHYAVTLNLVWEKVKHT
jgi:hypothetical protein